MSSTDEAEARRLLHLPQSIRDRIKAGQQMIDQYYGPDGKLRSPEEREAAAAEAERQVQELEGAKGGETPEQPEEAPAEPTETQQGTTEVGGEEVTTTGKVATDEPWEQRYKSLQGLFNQMSRDQQARDREMAELRGQLDALTKKPAESKTVDLTPDTHLQPLTDQERASIGDDELLEFSARHAYQKIAPRIAQLEAKIAELEGGFKPIAQRVERVQHETLYSQMDRTLPDWRKQNEDPDFLRWLNDVDPFSRIQRKMVLQQGVDAGDADRVLTVFNTYRAETGTKSQTRQATTQPNRTDKPNGSGSEINGTGNGRVPLDTLVHPGRVRSAGTTTTQTATDEPPTVTRAELAQFRNDQLRGVYQNDPKKLAEWKEYFDKAIAAGRVV